jgi:hypothetical protein
MIGSHFFRYLYIFRDYFYIFLLYIYIVDQK